MSCPEQYLPAFEKAKQVYIERARTRRFLAKGGLGFTEALSLSCWQSADVRDLLMALRSVGGARADEILRQAKVSQTRRVRELTERQSMALIAALPARLRNVESA